MNSLKMISTFFYSIVNVLEILWLGNTPGQVALMFMIGTEILLYTLTPRFVMNVRELYMLDIHGRCGNDIDTGFGLSRGAGRSMGGTTTIGTIAFVEERGIGGLDDEEEIAIVEERMGRGDSDMQLVAV